MRKQLLGNCGSGVCILLTTEVVPEIFPNLNVVAHLVVPMGWGAEAGCFLIIDVILLLNGLVLIVYVYIHFFSLFNFIFST